MSALGALRLGSEISTLNREEEGYLHYYNTILHNPEVYGSSISINQSIYFLSLMSRFKRTNTFPLVKD
jgi:hypothetical protein